jgi:hypothetical protein
MTTLNEAHESLAHALRRLTEAHLDLPRLMPVDRDEAIGNLDQALTGVLEGYHSLYDSIGPSNSFNINFYGTPETATLLAIRNARHHNAGNRIRSYPVVLLRRRSAPAGPDLIVRYPDATSPTPLPLSWSDFADYLQATEKIRDRSKAGIRAYLGADRMDGYAAMRGSSRDQVFFDVMPLISNAMCATTPRIADALIPHSVEGDEFRSFFSTLRPHRIERHEVTVRGPKRRH